MCRASKMFVELARHFRGTGAPLPPSASKDPRTRLEQLASSAEGVQFLRKRAASLRRGRAIGEDCALLASIVEKLATGEEDSAASLREAIELFDRAAKTADDADDRDCWKQEAIRVRRQLAADDAAAAGNVKNPEVPREHEIERCDAATLSVSEFMRRFAVPRCPVVLTGLVKEIASPPLSLAAALAAMGERSVPVKKHVPRSVRWARLEECGTMRFDRLVQQRRRPRLGGGEATEPEPAAKRPRRNEKSAGASLDEESPCVVAESMYLHDFGLPLGAPELLDGMSFAVPKFFAADYLQLAQRAASSSPAAPPPVPDDEGGASSVSTVGAAAPSSSSFASLLFADAWPSLFVGAKGTMSDVHIDSVGTHFWMALMEGTKRFTVWHPREVPHLKPRWWEGSLEPTFDVDLAADAPLAASRWATTLRAGELIFVPANAPHHALNLTDSLAISANYIDSTNFEAAMAELEVVALTSTRASELLATLRGGAFQRALAEREREWERGGGGGSGKKSNVVAERAHVPWLRFKRGW